MTFRGRACVGLFVLAMLATGCGSTDVVESPQSGATTETASAHSTPRAVVEVQDAGAEPRSPLSLTLTEGDSQHSTMAMTMGLSMEINGHKVPTAEVPTMRMGMVIDITDVSEDGVVSSTFGYDDVTVDGDDDMARQLEAKMAVLKDVHGTMQVTETGDFVSADLDLPADLDPTMRTTMANMKDQFANMMVPLPQEPVGVGARWTAHTESELNGINLTMDAHYRLVERDGDRVVLEVSLDQKAGDQVIELPNVPDGVVSHLSSMHLSGSSRVVVDLGHPLPVESRMEIGGPMRMTVQQGKQHMDMLERMHMVMELAPRG
jgi:hypothetical protein